MNYGFEKKKLKAYLGNDIYDSLKDYNCIIAGGMIISLFCNKEINDVDVYFRNTDDLADFVLENIIDSRWILCKSDKALLVKWNKLNVQLIYFDTFENINDLFNTFDFTVCMGAFDFKTEEFILHNDFLKHNTQKILKFNSKTAFPLVSALRVDKYKTKGYTISKEEFMRIILTCSLSNINTYEQFKEQVGGMYGINYDKFLKPSKDEEFDLVKTIEKMSNLCLQDEYFKSESKELEIDFDKLIFEITKRPFEYFEHDGRAYACGREFSEKSKHNIATSPEMYKKVELFGDVIKDNKLYKYVMKNKNNKYYSFYDTNFEYKLNAEVLGYNEHSYGSGIYCGLYEYKHDFSYYAYNDSVLIELEVNPDDLLDVNYKGIFKFKKVKFVREVEEKDKSSF